MPMSVFAAVALGIVTFSLGFYHFVYLDPRLRTILNMLEGEGGLGAESIARLRDSQVQFAKRTEERLGELERLVRREVHRVGFVRYNSFNDVDSELSFSLALLNSEGDGIVLTSIHSGDGTRSYGKTVRKFVPEQGASKEEQAAIAKARVSG